MDAQDILDFGMIILKGANVNVVDKNLGRTPLPYAAAAGKKCS